MVFGLGFKAFLILVATFLALLPRLEPEPLELELEPLELELELLELELELLELELELLELEPPVLLLAWFTSKQVVKMTKISKNLMLKRIFLEMFLCLQDDTVLFCLPVEVHGYALYFV